MKPSPHPLLAGLFHQAAAPAQLLEQARLAQSTLDALAGGLERVGFEAIDPWAVLLEVPLASVGVGTGLQAVLDQLAAAAAAPDQTPAAGHAARALPRDGVTRRHERAAASPVGAAAAAAASSAAGAATARAAAAPGISARSAAATWQQRAADANLQAAYATPLRPLAWTAMPGPAPDPAGELSDTTRGFTIRPPAEQAAIAATARIFAEQKAASDGSVQQRLNAALERIGQGPAPARADVERSVARGSRPPAEMAEASLLPSAATASPWDRAAAWPNGGVAPETRSSASPAAEPRAVLTAGSGLRGLAARAATWQPAPLNSTTSNSPAATALAAEPGSSPLADEQLVEQLARLLKREAQRDGIDVSDVSP